MKNLNKDKSRLNTTGSDDNIVIDIQNAIESESSLSLVADNIQVMVENEIVTLKGEVYSEKQRMLAGDIASIRAGEDNFNNYLSVKYQS